MEHKDGVPESGSVLGKDTIRVLAPSPSHLMTQLTQSRKPKNGPPALRYIWLTSTEIVTGQAQLIPIKSLQKASSSAASRPAWAWGSVAWASGL